MRNLRTTPKNKDFYDEHGRALTTYRTLATLGQTLSGAGVALAVYVLTMDALTGRGLTLGTVPLVAAALTVGLFVELANRALARPAIRPLVVRDQFAGDDERRRRHVLLTRFARVGLLLVGALSLVLSYVGSMDAGRLMTDTPPPAPVDSLVSAWSADTAALLLPLRTRARAAQDQFAALADRHRKSAADYAECARRGNAWCRTKQRRALAKIDDARAALNATLATVATERGTILAAALTGRNQSLTDARRDAAALAQGAQATASGRGYLFAMLTLAGQLVFYLMLYLVLQVEAGSGIDYSLQPNEFANLPSVTADLRAVVAHRTERGARRLMAHLFGRRAQLDAPVPYVALEGYPAHPVDPPAAPYPPGFYRSAEDPHTRPISPSPPPITHTAHMAAPCAVKPSPTAPPAPAADMSAADLAQRLKQYKKRLGAHEQKAIAQRRTGGVVKPRTAAAIANNRRWVDHYTTQLKRLTDAK